MLKFLVLMLVLSSGMVGLSVMRMFYSPDNVSFVLWIISGLIWAWNVAFSARHINEELELRKQDRDAKRVIL